jgi:hypothetical protein
VCSRDLQRRVSVFILSIDRDTLFLDKLLDGSEITVAYSCPRTIKVQKTIRVSLLCSCILLQSPLSLLAANQMLDICELVVEVVGKRGEDRVGKWRPNKKKSSGLFSGAQLTGSSRTRFDFPC